MDRIFVRNESLKYAIKFTDPAGIFGYFSNKGLFLEKLKNNE